MDGECSGDVLINKGDDDSQKLDIIENGVSFANEDSQSLASSCIESLEKRQKRLSTSSVFSITSTARNLEGNIYPPCFMPYSSTRICWDVIIFMSIWYNSVVSPLRLFIMTSRHTPSDIVNADIAFDIIFVIDTLVHFYLPYVDEDTGQVVTDKSLIRKKYYESSRFRINAITCIPILKFFLSALNDNSRYDEVIYIFCLVIRMLRTVHFSSQFKELKMVLSMKNQVNDSVFRLCVILFFTLLMMTMFGSLYFGISTININDICPEHADFKEKFLGADNWVSKDYVITDVMDKRVCEDYKYDVSCNECPQVLFFSRSLYFLMQTLFTIGYGDSVTPSTSQSEMVLACIFLLFGVFLYGLIIANMTSVLSNLDVVGMRFRKEKDDVLSWLSLNSFPEALKQRINMFYGYIYRKQYGMLETNIFKDLPPALRQKLANQRLDYIRRVPFFAGHLRSDIFLEKIALSFVHRVHTPGSYILFQSELQRELIIVVEGRVDIVIKESPEAIGTLNPGDFMGDYQLLFGTINQVSIKSPDFSEVLSLSHYALMGVMKDFSLQGYKVNGFNNSNFRGSTDAGVIETYEKASMYVSSNVSCSVLKKKFGSLLFRPPNSNMQKLVGSISNIARTQKSKKIKDMMTKDDGHMNLPWYIVQPNSKCHVYRDVLRILAIMFYSICIPIRLAASFQQSSIASYFSKSFVLDYVIDLVFIADMFNQMNFYAFSMYDGGREIIVSDHNLIRERYLSSKNSIIDFVATIPFDLVSIAVGYSILMRIPKMVRLLQLPGVVEELQKHFELSMNFLMNEAYLSTSVMFLMSINLLVWSSSGWNALRKDEEVYQSVYWAFTTLTTVGYGDLTPTNLTQTLYTVCVGIIGVTFFAGIIANVTNFIHNHDVSEQSFEHKNTCIKWFMERNDFTLDQINAIDRYFRLIEIDDNGLDEEFLLNKIVPTHVKNSLLLHRNRSIIMDCELFADYDNSILRFLILKLNRIVVPSKEFIIKSDLPAEGMFFVRKGSVELLTVCANGNLKLKRLVEPGEYFAEGALFHHWRTNPYIARAAFNTTLWYLSRIDFQKVLTDHDVKTDASASDSSKVRKLSTRRKSIRMQTFIKAIERASSSKSIYIHPDSNFVKVWSIIVLFILLYFAVAIPFRIAFMENYELGIVWLLTDYVGDAVLVSDSIMHAFIFAYYDDVHLVFNRDTIWNQFKVSGKLKTHLISVLPLDVTYLAIQTMCPLWKLQMWSLFRLNRLCRCGELKSIMSQVESSFTKAGVKVPKNQLKVWKLAMLIILSAHLVGCIFFMIANFNQHAASNGMSEPQNWLHDEGLVTGVSECPGNQTEWDLIVQQYIAALYWSMATLTTVGYGDVTANLDSFPEIAFATCILVAGTSIYTYVIALLEEIVSELDVTSTLYKQKLNRVEEYSRLQGMPDKLKARIATYYEGIWRMYKGASASKIFSHLPSHLRAEMKYRMVGPILSKVFFLRECDTNFIVALMKYLDFELCMPEDFIFREGELCTNLLFVYSGEVHLLTPKGIKFETSTKCILGEMSFFHYSTHPFAALASNTCELFVLSINNFTRCLEERNLVEKYSEYFQMHGSLLEKSKVDMVKMIENFASSKMTKMLDIEVKSNLSKYIILPDSFVWHIWNSWAFFAVSIYIFLVPLQISFKDDNLQLSGIIFDVVTDLTFILDIYLNCYHFATVKDGSLITSPVEFRKIYLQSSFLYDFLSALPVSLIVYLIGCNARTYGFFRLFHSARIRRVGQYLSSLFELVNSKTSFNLSTGQERILLMFLIVLVFNHCFACIFHLLGDLNRSNDVDTWLTIDGTLNKGNAFKYLRSLYWSFYTVTTVGYGSVQVVTLSERILAMIVMLIGAVICDAGITAVLTSLVSGWDSQAGTNNRRVSCCKQFMASYVLPDGLRSRILKFYEYNDKELCNIDEEAVLSDLSANLRRDILCHFCLAPIEQSPAFARLSNGAIYSMVNAFKPYLAIPDEYISDMGKECQSIFILQRGRLLSLSSLGNKAYYPPQALLGHPITSAISKKLGNPKHLCVVEIISVKGIKYKQANPYAIITCGEISLATEIKKSIKWKEKVEFHLSKSTTNAAIALRTWNKNGDHSLIGEALVPFPSSSDNSLKTISLKDHDGRSGGLMKIRILIREFTKEESALLSHKMSAIAVSFCHLYEAKNHVIERIKEAVLEEKKTDAVSRYKDTREVLRTCDECKDNPNNDFTYVESSKSKDAGELHDNGQDNKKNKSRFRRKRVIPVPDDTYTNESYELNGDVEKKKYFEWDNLVQMPQRESAFKKSYLSTNQLRKTFYSEWGID